MDHNRIAESQAIERYLLGEMPPEERDAFEEHYFSCAECAQEVRSAARFRANVREVMREPERFSAPEQESRRASWWSLPSLAPLAASVLLLGVVVYQAGFQIPSLKRQAQATEIAEAFVPFSVRETARGAGDNLTRIPSGIAKFSVSFDLPPDAAASSITCTITDSAGKIIAEPVLPVARGAESLGLKLDRAYFPPGPYTITLRGVSGAGPGNPAPQYKFIVE